MSDTIIILDGNRGTTVEVAEVTNPVEVMESDSTINLNNTVLEVELKQDTKVIEVSSVQGKDGVPGMDGLPGEDGDSAYEIAVKNGYTGTESDWLYSLIGPSGAPGAAGEVGPNLVDTTTSTTLSGFVVGDGSSIRAASEPDFSQALDNRFLKLTGGELSSALSVREGVNTDAVIMKDTSGNKKWAIKHNTNIVKYDHYSPEPVNKLLNSGFETDLTSWTEDIGYTLNDEFTTDRAAGSVNGTSAEPTGGTRKVVDTTNKLSIANNKLTNYGGTTGAFGNPALWHSSTARSAGKILTGTINLTSISGEQIFGFDTDQTGYTGAEAFYINANKLYSALGTIDLSAFSAGIDYQLAIDLRNTGSYYFIKGGAFTNWTLLWVSSTGSTATLYPATLNKQYADDLFTVDNIRIPTSTWLPTPLAYDTFTRADGAIGSSETTGPDSQTTPSLAWSGGAISSNKLVITPESGSDMFDTGAGTFDSGVYHWLPLLSNTVENDSGTLKITYVNHDQGARVYLNDSNDLNSNLTVGNWYDIQFDAKVNTGSVGFKLYDTSIIYGHDITSTTFQTKHINFRALHATNSFLYHNSMGSGEIAWWDNISLKPLTLSSLFSALTTSDTDVIASTDVTVTPGTQAGLVTNLDSASSPTNFLIAYHDGTRVKLDKNVGGTYTNLISSAATYTSGATLRVVTYHSDANTLKVRVYYNNALIGSEQTVSDAGIISNTKHGLFSTYSGNSFDNFSLFARGTGGEYGEAPFEELTVTRDTTTKYAGTASAKLVAGGTAGNYLQSVNVGDTSTYTLICYAYTDGTAVDTNDLNLYYDTGTISTTFTDMGSGWYRLTGTLAGVASAKNYGVRVKAGKTVYIDTVSLQAGAGATIEVTFENSSSGSSNYGFEGNVTVGGELTVGTQTLTEDNIAALKNLL